MKFKRKSVILRRSRRISVRRFFPPEIAADPLRRLAGATLRMTMLIFFCFLLIAPVSVLAETSPAELKQIDQKTELIESRIKQLKSVQSQILDRQAQILSEINSLRIWIRRNRG